MKVFIPMQYSQLSLMTQAPNKSILCLHMGFIIHFISLILLGYFHHLILVSIKVRVESGWEQNIDMGFKTKSSEIRHTLGYDKKKNE